MASYNSFERRIAKLIESFPWLREFIKIVYKRFNFLLYRNSGFKFKIFNGDKLYSPYDLLGKEMPKGENLFFGYYDKSPWNKSMTKLVYHSYLDPRQASVSIKLFDLVSKEVKVIAETSTWNFQQGAMTQWINDETIIFNTLIEDDMLGAKSINVKTGDEKAYNLPIQCVRSDGRLAISLNYKRLMVLRPDYGYTQEVNNFKSNQDYNTDGLWKLDLRTGEQELILKISDLKNIEPKPSMEISEHKVNHVMFSPNGENVIFMHRWLGSEGKWSRLYSYNLKAKKLIILLDDRMISHYSWKDEFTVVTWARSNGKDGYYLINIENGDIRPVKDESINIKGDGHPTFNPLKDTMISDSYPDKARIQHLFKYDMTEQSMIKIGEFFAPWKFNESARCDLHPRWSPNGQHISIDSSHNGLRRTYILEVL